MRAAVMALEFVSETMVGSWPSKQVNALAAANLQQKIVFRSM